MPYSVLFPVGRHDPRARIGDEGFSICRWRSGHDKDRDSALASVRDSKSPVRRGMDIYLTGPTNNDLCVLVSIGGS